MPIEILKLNKRQRSMFLKAAINLFKEGEIVLKDLEYQYKDNKYNKVEDIFIAAMTLHVIRAKFKKTKKSKAKKHNLCGDIFCSCRICAKYIADFKN